MPKTQDVPNRKVFFLFRRQDASYTSTSGIGDQASGIGDQEWKMHKVNFPRCPSGVDQVLVVGCTGPSGVGDQASGIGDQETIPDYCPVVLRFLEISEMTA